MSRIIQAAVKREGEELGDGEKVTTGGVPEKQVVAEEDV